MKVLDRPATPEAPIAATVEVQTWRESIRALSAGRWGHAAVEESKG